MQSKRNRDRYRLWMLVMLVGAVAFGALALLGLLTPRQQPPVAVRYGDLIQSLKASQSNPRLSVHEVQVGHGELRGEFVSTDRVSTPTGETTNTQTVPFRTARTGFENDQQVYALLRDSPGAGYQGTDGDSALRTVGNGLLTVVMFLVLGLGILLLIRWMTGGGSPFTFGRSRAKLYARHDEEVTFQDVAGIDEALQELREVVDFLSHPDKYRALGGRIPKGVLLVGPPGTGKTLLARAVAGEAGVPFFSLSGSEFVEMFVGVGAARVRDLFSTAENKAPAIIFIDELDALGKTRAGAVVGGHDEREQTLNQLLVEMDGFDANRGLIIMAATNRPETLDPALLRPGRFDRTVVVDRPDVGGREAILKVHAREVVLGSDVDLRRVAALTPGAVGADLANLVNEAALMAARAGRKQVMMADFDEAVERSAVGLERRSRIMNPEEKQRVAYHEAGHALVACSLPNTHPVHKISIVPRGVGALGYVLSRPDEDRYLVTRSELDSRIRVALGGTLAEEIVYQEISNGATNDLEQASDTARRMVKQFGMSRLGRVCFQDSGGPGFLGAGGDAERSYSEATAREIDLEVRKILEDATQFVRELLLHRREALEAIARRLMEKEVIDNRELWEILERHNVNGRVASEAPAAL